MSRQWILSVWWILALSPSCFCYWNSKPIYSFTQSFILSIRIYWTLCPSLFMFPVSSCIYSLHTPSMSLPSWHLHTIPFSFLGSLQAGSWESHPVARFFCPAVVGLVVLTLLLCSLLSNLHENINHEWIKFFLLSP